MHTFHLVWEDRHEPALRGIYLNGEEAARHKEEIEKCAYHDTVWIQVRTSTGTAPVARQLWYIVLRLIPESITVETDWTMGDWEEPKEYKLNDHFFRQLEVGKCTNNLRVVTGVSEEHGREQIALLAAELVKLAGGMKNLVPTSDCYWLGMRVHA